MNGKQTKKLNKLFRKDLQAKTTDVFKYFLNQKPWFIPKKLWIHWLLK